MIFAIPGFKVALVAAGAVGVGAAVASHWEDIKLIVENFDQVRQSIVDSIDQIREQHQREKMACSVGSGSDPEDADEHFDTPEIAYSSNYDDHYLSDDTISGPSLRHRRQLSDLKDEPDELENEPKDIFNSQSGTEGSEGSKGGANIDSDLVDPASSQLSMPSTHSLQGSELPTDTDTDDGGLMSEFSIISSDEEYP